jgi:hypothetical protein
MGELAPVGRILIGVGAALVVLGIALLLAHKVPYLGRLPGDFIWRRGSFAFYFPLATCLLVSLLASVILWLVRR